MSEAYLLDDMSNTWQHDTLKLALHLPYHQLLVEAVCPSKDEKTCGAEGEKEGRQRCEPA